MQNQSSWANFALKASSYLQHEGSFPRARVTASHYISLRTIEFKMVALSVKRSIETFTWPLQRHIKLLTPSNAEELRFGFLVVKKPEASLWAKRLT